MHPAIKQLTMKAENPPHSATSFADFWSFLGIKEMIKDEMTGIESKTFKIIEILPTYVQFCFGFQNMFCNDLDI